MIFLFNHRVIDYTTLLINSDVQCYSWIFFLWLLFEHI